MFPRTGPTGGVVEVNIGGTGFQPGATVTLDEAASNVIVVNSTLIKATAPTHAAGLVDVVVTNPGGQSGRLSAAYTYVLMTVSAISPTLGLTGGSVSVAGTGFLQGATLSLDGAAAHVFGVTSTVITATTPAHAAGTVDVVVTNPGGQSATLTGGYTFGTVSLTASPSLVTPGGRLSVSWVAPSGRSIVDWIALLKTGAPSSSYQDGLWQYTNGAVSGTLTFSAPIQPGEYEFRYFLDDDFIEAGQSNQVTVIAAASPAVP